MKRSTNWGLTEHPVSYEMDQHAQHTILRRIDRANRTITEVRVPAKAGEQLRITGYQQAEAWPLHGDDEELAAAERALFEPYFEEEET